jgi:quercetin dioxygenase-like cupin family protein
VAAQDDSVIENPRSGERVEFVSETSEALTMLTTWTRPGHRAAEHIHPSMEERFQVLEGRAAFAVDGIEVVATPGEVVVARPGSRHLAWNPTDAPVRLKIEMRPGLRWAEFTRRFFRGMIPCSSSANTAPRLSSRRD